MDNETNNQFLEDEEVKAQTFEDEQEEYSEDALEADEEYDDEYDDEPNTLIFTREDGEQTEYEHLDTVEVDGKQYLILLPVETKESGEVVIFRIEQKDGETFYDGVNDAEEAKRIFNIFKDKAGDEFDFVD